MQKLCLKNYFYLYRHEVCQKYHIYWTYDDQQIMDDTSNNTPHVLYSCFFVYKISSSMKKGWKLWGVLFLAIFLIGGILTNLCLYISIFHVRLKLYFNNCNNWMFTQNLATKLMQNLILIWQVFVQNLMLRLRLFSILSIFFFSSNRLLWSHSTLQL